MTNPHGPYYQDDLVTLYHGDCLDILPAIRPGTERLTERQRTALRVLSEHDRNEGFTPSAFATLFWPRKEWVQSNGPWGLGPDASGRHGGRMLTRLHSMGLVRFSHYYGYYTARISQAGRDALIGGE